MSAEIVTDSLNRIDSINRVRPSTKVEEKYHQNRLINVNLIIFVILNYLFSCILNNELILFNNIFKEHISKQIVNNLGWVFIVLSCLYILFHFLIHRQEKRKFEERNSRYI